MRGILKETEPKLASEKACCGSCCTFLTDVCGCKAISLRKMLISCCPQRQLDLEPLVTCPCFRSDSAGQVKNVSIVAYYNYCIFYLILAMPVSQLCLLRAWNCWSYANKLNLIYCIYFLDTKHTVV